MGLQRVKEEYGLSRSKIDFLFSALVVLFLIWALWEARNWPGHSRLFPWSLGFIVLSLALTQLGLAWRGIVRQGRTDPIGGTKGLDDIGKSPSGADNDPVSQKILVTPDTARQRGITICCWIVGFFIGIWLLGFKLGSLCSNVGIFKIYRTREMDAQHGDSGCHLSIFLARVRYYAQSAAGQRLHRRLLRPKLEAVKLCKKP